MTEPVRTVAVRWACPHCSRSRSVRKATVEHIARCWRNPDNRGCKTCEHYYRGDNGCGLPDCGPSCASPEMCHEGVDLTGGPRIHCERWEAQR